jgi:hypothetical protein
MSGDLSSPVVGMVGLGEMEAADKLIRKDVAVCSEVADELGADLESVLAVAQEV